MNRMIKYIQKICQVLEMAVAVIVLLGIMLSVVSLLKDVSVFQHLLNDMSSFQEFLEKIFVIVIGIEFLQMLCRPNSDHVLEVLIFLVARHMIIGDTSPYEDFVSIISVALLLVVRRYLHVNKEKEKGKGHLQREEADD